ncbi:MFS transporter [Pseudomonas sp. FW215-R2]|uniref:MFS transporter n=1 Tax=unclassified Pseudomonas TaxID=196821 RepID=UPI000C87E3FC|nr:MULTISPECIES: MFS transporter [unclassified Pseudomonas]PMW96245.1 MFS transporter [Pseudomonas sp. FW215-R2]PMX06374.1 MFS transporter [Pseudomonas sp. FW215-L1]PMX19545.1 MFS transporter [Pseudomonas sp. FW215-E1]PNA25222.1 MFS transporter [Pseudomonas sp. FW215-R4]
MLTGNPAAAAKAEQSASLSGLMVAFLAFCCGAVVANLYYAQPIVELIAPQIGLSSANASLIVSLTQMGYALGLLLLVPLADLMENRRLVVGFTLAASVALMCAGFTHSPSMFLVLSLLIGLTSVAVQILVPLAAHLAPEATRGRVVGNIMSGLLLGILLSRPLSSLLVEVFGWRGVFFSAAALMAFIALITAIALPRRVPTHQATYVALIGSVFALARRHPVLRQRSLYQGLLFASFSLFWTLAPIELMRHHGFSQVQVAIFALVGAVGAVAAPIAGRLADAGHGRRGTLVALLLAPVSLLIAALPGSSYIWLVVCAVLLDFAVQLNMVLGQREVYAIDPHSRARLNAVYMTSIFVGGALGSLVASPLYEHFGWHLSAVTVALLPALALAMFLGRKANA